MTIEAKSTTLTPEIQQRFNELQEMGCRFRTALQALGETAPDQTSLLRCFERYMSAQLLLAVRDIVPTIRIPHQLDNLCDDDLRRFTSRRYRADCLEFNLLQKIEETMEEAAHDIGWSMRQCIADNPGTRYALLGAPECSIKQENYIVEWVFYTGLVLLPCLQPSPCGECGSADTELLRRDLLSEESEKQGHNIEWRIRCRHCGHSFVHGGLKDKHSDGFRRTETLSTWKRWSDVMLEKKATT